MPINANGHSSILSLKQSAKETISQSGFNRNEIFEDGIYSCFQKFVRKNLSLTFAARLTPNGDLVWKQRSGRAVYCTGLENRRPARVRGFESLLLCNLK